MFRGFRIPLAKTLDQHQVFSEVIHLSEEQRALVRRHVEAVPGVPIEREDAIDLSCSEAEEVDRRLEARERREIGSVAERIPRKSFLEVDSVRGDREVSIAREARE